MNVGKPEGFEDKLRSILAQFHYVFEIRNFATQGIPFNLYMYVPERPPEINDVSFEKENEAHLINVVLLVHITYFVECSTLQVILEVVDQLR